MGAERVRKRDYRCTFAQEGHICECFQGAGSLIPRSAVHPPSQRAASAIAARCVGTCSALRQTGHPAAAFSASASLDTLALPASPHQNALEPEEDSRRRWQSALPILTEQDKREERQRPQKRRNIFLILTEQDKREERQRPRKRRSIFLILTEQDKTDKT